MRRKVFIVVISAAVFGLAVSCYAQEEASKLGRFFYMGNDYYEKGEYLKAIDEYNKVITAGYESGALYYNLGNAYFRSGALGKAILNYERAERFILRDADLRANYRFARAKISGKVLEKKGIWNWRPLRLYSENFTINELLWLTTGIYILVIILLTIAVQSPGIARRIFIVVLLFFLLGIWNSLIIWHKVRGIGRDAVVILPQVESRYGPFDSATKFFKLYEGIKVRVLKDKADWDKIERADGKVGWVKKGAIEII
ncbi:MAG: tetratricopeptide repeat protein [Candidatus Omnitrophota bacterium]